MADKGYKLGEKVVIYIGHYAGCSGSIRDTTRTDVKVRIGDYTEVWVPKKYIARENGIHSSVQG